MTHSFTTLWTNDRCELIKQYNLEGTVLDILFGGPHTSEPSFRRAGVKTGDYIYPIRVNKGVLYVLSRMRVREILSLEDYIERFEDVFAGCEKSQWSSFTFENYLKLHPERRFLAPTCTTEVILGDDSVPIRLDVAVPPKMIENLRFRSQRQERGIRHLKDGVITHVISLQGIYRLSEKSAADLEELLFR